MQEQFGHVTVTYDEETALLQQPRPEDLLAEQLLEEGFDCKRAQAPSFPVLYHLSQLRGNLTEWLPGENDRYSAGIWRQTADS